jgi:hypothetical protein
MSWNTSAILIKSGVGEKAEKLFEILGFPNAQFVRHISFDEASSDRLIGRALAVSNGWTVIFDPKAFGLFANAQIADGYLPQSLELRLARTSLYYEVFAFMLAGTSSTAAFTHFVGGSRVRCLLMQEGTPAIDLGAPSEIETAVMAEESDMESAVLTIAERLGFDLFAEPPPRYSLFSFAG